MVKAGQTISVALCTYNGGKRLKSQLDSYLTQQRLPDELIVCDDCSSDNTLQILDSYAREAPFPVRIEVNSANLRSTKNFEKAIGLCRGDIIALSDQDDVWKPEKLAHIAEWMARDPQVAYSFSNAAVVDDELTPYGETLWDAVGFSRSEQASFATEGFRQLLKWNRVTGATMAFRSCWRNLLLPIPREWVHDAWIALILSGVSSGSPIPKALIRYRQHQNQQIGERKRGLLQQFRVARLMSAEHHASNVAKFRQLLERLESYPNLPREALTLLTEKVEHLQVRASLRVNHQWRLPFVLQEWFKGRYTQYSRGWKACAQDLFLN
jgi:glycosyltransferase involved in cell wall biosynthesis